MAGGRNGEHAASSSARLSGMGLTAARTRYFDIRRRLEPLAASLEARPSSDHRDVARTARHVATTQV